MEFVEFKLPEKINKKLSSGYYISYIAADYDGLKMAFGRKNCDYDIVFDFGSGFEDYRVSDEGRCLDHHLVRTPEHWLFIEIKDSEYLKKLNKESRGVLLAINPDLKHYIVGDEFYCIDIVSRSEPEVYVVKKEEK